MRRATIRSHDPIRYVVVATVGREWTLYYSAESAGLGSHVSVATLFKERKVAEAVRKALRDSRKRRGFRVVKVRKTKAGVRLVGKLNPGR